MQPLKDSVLDNLGNLLELFQQWVEAQREAHVALLQGSSNAAQLNEQANQALTTYLVSVSTEMAKIRRQGASVAPLSARGTIQAAPPEHQAT